MDMQPKCRSTWASLTCVATNPRVILALMACWGRVVGEGVGRIMAGRSAFNRRLKWCVGLAIGVMCVVWPDSETARWSGLPWSSASARGAEQNSNVQHPQLAKGKSTDHTVPRGKLSDSSVDSTGSVNSDTGEAAADTQMNSKIPPGITSFILLGVDSRNGEPARADTIIVALVDASQRKVALLSIPRDTRTPVAGYGVTKINHAMAYGGAPLLRKTVENLIHWHIDYVADANFSAFRSVVDQMGGLDIDVEENMSYDDPTDRTSIHLTKGPQHLTGQQVLDYARFRHDPEADTGRMRRQKQVLREILAQSTSYKMWPKLPSMIAAMSKEIHTDTPIPTLLRFASRFLWTNDQEMTVLQLHGTNAVNSDDNLWYFYMDKEEPWRLHDVIKKWEHET